jgi:hypothetical protein
MHDPGNLSTRVCGSDLWAMKPPLALMDIVGLAFPAFTTNDTKEIAKPWQSRQRLKRFGDQVRGSVSTSCLATILRRLMPRRRRKTERGGGSMTRLFSGARKFKSGRKRRLLKSREIADD